ncbi:MAG: rod shape-determining protein RodA [Candidatus Eisenbacteria bacterium]|nr:rod shape-determining protein RodA [Candidatus Latescibacterota bacterium]MBD3302614.1 rod shape-determining protein RodA [Candidatus Eisenbacteria bacterium]
MRAPGPYRAYLRRFDWGIALAAFALVLIGLYAVYSATQFPDSPREDLFLRHLLALPVALGAMLVMMAIPLRTLEDLAWPIYGGCLLILLLVLLVGMEAYGARRWLVFGPVRLQPAEIAKIGTIIALANYLARKRRSPDQIRTLFAALGLIALPLLLILRQPDLGTAGAIPALGIGILLWAGLPMVHLLVLASPLLGLALRPLPILWGLFVVASLAVLWRRRVSGLVLALFLLVHGGLFLGAPVVWDRLEPYQRDRITTFLQPEGDPGGAGYQIIQSKITIGSGWIWGKGPLAGTQKALAFLPQQHTDFIFGVIGEELGFLGTSVTLLLFLLLILRAFRLVVQCRSPFAGLLAGGLGSLLLYHVGVNLAMTVGLLPVTGLPLPFLSYGGSFLVAMFAVVGLLLNVSAHRFDY